MASLQLHAEKLDAIILDCLSRKKLRCLEAIYNLTRVRWTRPFSITRTTFVVTSGIWTQLPCLIKCDRLFP